MATDKEKFDRDCIAWDTVNWGRAIDYWLQFSEKNLTESKVLEIGSSGGGISLWFALKGAQVLCSDLEGPKDIAKELHQRYGVSEKIKYANIDGMNIPFKNEFDIVVFKSVLGGVGRRDTEEDKIKTILEIKKCLKLGGEIWFAENLKATPVHQFARKHFRKRNYGRWRYPSIQEITRYMRFFSQLQFRTLGLLGTFGRGERQRRFFGRIDQTIDRFVPDSWRYIIAGIAIKT